jgi:hypothetical protein
VANTPTSYSGSPGFDRLSRLSFSWFYLVLQANALIVAYLKIRPRSFPIQYYSLIILSSTLYNLVTEKASLNKLPNNLT